MTYSRAPLSVGDRWPQRECDDDPLIAEEVWRPPASQPAPGRGQTVASSNFSRKGEPAPVRYADRPMPIGTRLFGLGGTGLVCALIVGAGLIKWQTSYHAPVTTTLSVFDVAEPEAPPALDSEIPPGPEQVQKEESPQIEAPRIPPPLISLPSVNAVSLPEAKPADNPGPPVEQTTAPESRPLPPGSQMSDAKPTWEGQVLTALNQAKRYPREARRNRQQGTPWVRFVMDREGRVRSVRLERSSGFDALDREALALPRRASPLPKPPESITGERVELVVPIEFFLQ